MSIRSSKRIVSSYEKEKTDTRINPKRSRVSNPIIPVGKIIQESNDDEKNTQRYFQYNIDIAGEMPILKQQLHERDISNWNRLPDDSKSRCIKSVVRLLTIRGKLNSSILIKCFSLTIFAFNFIIKRDKE